MLVGWMVDGCLMDGRMLDGWMDVEKMDEVSWLDGW